jgi:hypothetical protein
MKNYLLCFVCIACSVAVADIETLRQRAQDSSVDLTASEKDEISEFWSTTLNQMFLSESSIECVEIRRQLATHKGSNPLSHYTVVYIAEAKSTIESALGDTQRMENTQQRQMIEQNLVILTAELQSSDLASLALQYLGDENDVVRYWAVKAVTNSGVVAQLTSDITGDDRTTKTILTALGKRASVETQPQMQKMVVRFCMALDDPSARDILLLIADNRIKAYRDWAIGDEALDVSLLTALGNVAVLREDPDKKIFGHKFSELYALTIQRYLKGKDTLSKSEVGQLLTVIAEVDQSVLDKKMGIQTGILQSLKRKTGLEQEYELLFGDRTRQGQLAEKFKFDYGKDGAGKPITTPPALGPMPGSIEE